MEPENNITVPDPSKKGFNSYILYIVPLLFIGIILFVLFGNKPGSNNKSKSSMGNEPQSTITATSSGFSPSTLTVKVGTRVIWMNKSGKAVAVNSNPHPTHTDYPALNLGEFSNNSSVQLVFDKKGTYGYHNHLKPEQTGKVVVE